MALGKGLGSLIPASKIKKKSDSEYPPRPAGGASERLLDVPISEIVPNRSQPRKNFSHEQLDELAASIKEHGVLQPILLTELPEGGYELIAGERRLRASQMAGLSKIPAMVRGADNLQRLQLAIVENVQREDLNPMERAQAFARLHHEFGLSHEDIARAIGISRPVVSNAIRLLNLPAEIQQALIDERVKVMDAVYILGLRKHDQQMAMFHKILSGEVRSTHGDLRKVVEGHGEKARKGVPRRDPNISSSEKIIEERLGTKVEITRRGEGGNIKIFYYSKEEFNRLLSELSGKY